jgi:hypothetical protein
MKLFVLLVAMLGSCASDPMTDIVKFRKVGTEEFPGLELDGYMRRSEAVAAGYVRRDGVWVSPWQIDRETTD